ncbi:MAG TPA: SMP-30/gluconolactonase/LRE family protein [Candidatus Angelobacter sp.]
MAAPAQGPRTSSIETIAGATASDRAGKEFSFGAVAGLATDAVGNTYFTIQPLSQVFRLGTDGRVTAYAGNGVRGESIDGPAVASPLASPSSLAADSTGNLFIASASGLLRVDAVSGLLSVVFKTPRGRRASAGETFSIDAMAVGPDGLLYISDGRDHRIKSYSPASGVVTIVAGNGELGPTQPGSAATSTPLMYPRALAVAPDGTVYFCTQEPAVFRIRPDNGNIEAINLRLKDQLALDDYDIPRGIALDASGHLYVAQANRSRILRVELKTGKLSVYAGTGSQHFNGDRKRADKAAVDLPTFIAMDATGNLMIAEESRIRRVEASNQRIATVVGNGLPVTSRGRAPADESRLWEPANAVAAPDGTIYVTSSFSQRLLRIDSHGEMSTVAGGGSPGLGDEPGPALKVALNYPQGIWLEHDGTVYFSDRDNRVVRRLRSKSVSNFAITPKNTMGAGVFLHSAAALVGDANYLYMSDPNGHRVWRISRRDGYVDPYVGTGSAVPLRSYSPSADGEPATSVELVNPSGLALDPSGNLYVAEGAYMGRKMGRILRVDAATGTTKTVLSDLRQPSGLAFKSPGVLCFSETGGNQVRCLDLASGAVKVVAGTSVAGFGGDGGPAECAQLNRPLGISFDSMGNLYIADTGNQRVRLVHLGSDLAPCHDRQTAVDKPGGGAL